MRANALSRQGTDNLDFSRIITAGDEVFLPAGDACMHTDYLEFPAVREGDGTPVRITLFSEEVSDRPLFRRALRHDCELLRGVHNESLVPLVAWGEADDGRMFVAWEAIDEAAVTTEKSAASSGRNGGRTDDHAWDDVVEAMWEACSAIQHLHNHGMLHGAFNDACLHRTASGKSVVSGHRVAIWLELARAEQTEDAYRLLLSPIVPERLQSEMRDIGMVLKNRIEHVAKTLTAKGKPAVIPSRLRTLVELLTVDSDAERPDSLRSLQGCLGELLLQAGGEEMPLVSERSELTGNRMSLIDGMFAADSAESAAQSQRPTENRRIIVLTILLLVVIVAGLVISSIW